MASTEGGSVPSGVGYVRGVLGVPLLSRLGDLRKRRELPAGSGAQPRPITDFGVFELPTERSFLHL